MKKYICILASAALLVACEQKTETVAPAASPGAKTENNTTVVNPSAPGVVKEKETNTNTTTTASTPAMNSETKTESSTMTTSSPSP